MADNDEQQTEGSQLRQKLEAALAELKDLKAYKKANELSSAFSDFGLDPNTGAGRLAAEAYDGELDATAARDWLTENGFTKPDTSEQEAPQEPPVGMGQRIEQQTKLEAVREAGSPSNGQRISKDDLAALEKTDPRAAVKAWQEGRVEGMSPPAA